MKLETRVKLGATGLEISRVGFGGITIQRIDQPGTKELLRAAHEMGVNFIDTARGYTVSESWIGQALEELGLRDRFVLATKCRGWTKEEMEQEIAASLKNLRTDHIELYQLHNPSLKDLETVLAPGGAMEALLEAKEKGIIGHIGLTAHLTAVFERGLELPEIETIMFPYNIVEQQGSELMARCSELGKGFIAMKPLAGGAIEDADLAIRYILANPNCSVAIPGVAARKELEQNVKAGLDDSPLSQQELERVDAVRKQLGTNFCRRCNYCAPCSVGLSIPSAFLFHGYLDRYGLEDWARDRYSTMSVKAGDCVQCGVCETRCPYQLPIRQMLKKVAEDFGA